LFDYEYRGGSVDEEICAVSPDVRVPESPRLWYPQTYRKHNERHT